MKLWIMLIVVLFFPASTFAIDLRPYFPVYQQTELRSSNNIPNTRYTFVQVPSGFLPLYTQFFTLNKPGYHITWQKEYWKQGKWCTSTYAILFFGDDLSVTEVGDWYASTPCTPNVVFGYKGPGNANTGLGWAPIGGLETTPSYNEMSISRQLTPGTAYLSYGYSAYSKIGLIDIIPIFTLPTGQSFNNVAHLILYHGTKGGQTRLVRCSNSPLTADGVYYQSYKDYNSYAIELWLAPNMGVIQERIPFIENGEYWKIEDCQGALFGNAEAWLKYVYP